MNFIIRIGYAHVLPQLFQEVIIPPHVASELSGTGTPLVVREWMAEPPRWLTIRTPGRLEPIPRIDPGEEAAISLALELRGDLLLMDDRAGRMAAVERQNPVTGTIGVLERAARQRLLDLTTAFARLKEQTDFWNNPALLDARLKLHLPQQA